MQMLKRAGRTTAFFAAITAALLAFVYASDPRRDAEYDPIAIMLSDESLSVRRNHWEAAEYKYLVANFERFKPVVKKWALTQPEAYGHEIAIDAAVAAGRPGVHYLMDLTHEARPSERAELVRQLGLRLHTAEPWREDVRAFLMEVEKENTVAGHYAYLGLATSDFRYARDYSEEDRERAFRDHGLDPYSDRAEVSADFRPKKSAVNAD